ncbi:TadE/TadG family type IV pilus assembly protein [Kordiimonas sp. SCSIO 12610]|uniref:TadE/TadG family type IV pilus assembly protein n=1 Tax=Kordiimonas sp. SCSIO 12610 TaxID=2829597 RepID=UPI00210C83A2|nr:TadE family protein [Kordiimonas sp. SCSIO 12610]UTW56012.1 pilus assembly protein [Kordiimonas sp. SCSIO 12610]
MINRLRKLRNDETGSIVTEFAITLPIFLTMIFGIFEVGYYFYLSTAIENAVLSASRFGITGGTLNESFNREQQVREIVLAQTFGSLDPASLEIETSVFEQFADIGLEPEPFVDDNNNGQYDEGEEFTDVNGNGVYDDNLGEAGLGNAGDIVLYKIIYRGASLTGFGEFFADGYTIEAAVAVRNEPFPIIPSDDAITGGNT